MPGLIKELSHNAFKCASLEMQKLDKRNMTNINNRNENATHKHTLAYMCEFYDVLREEAEKGGEHSKN